MLSNVIENGYCVGCGACAGTSEPKHKMVFGDNGKYEPVAITTGSRDRDANLVCPFSNDAEDEDAIGSELFQHSGSIKHDQHLGYYLKTFAGYVKDGPDRENGSSGGFGTWLLRTMLATNLIDYVIHVKVNADGQSKILFKYAISDSVDSIKAGAKSKYYPVEISEVLDHVRKHPGRYAFVGVPCFVKAVRLLAKQDPIIAERIKYAVGLVCGHLKTDRFAKSMAWQMGIEPNDLIGFDFRVKLEGRSANNYGVEAIGCVDGTEVVKRSPINQLCGTNWGHGFFKLKACDYCDDVLAETADITIGDAWLPEYVGDSQGTNIVIIRNAKLQAVIEQHTGELHLDDLTAERIYTSQAGGFRHRREGLAYRLFLKDKGGEWRPKKRVEASDKLSTRRKLIYAGRLEMMRQCELAYKHAEQKGDLSAFIKHMNTVIRDYDALNKTPMWLSILKKGKRIAKQLLSRTNPS